MCVTHRDTFGSSFHAAEISAKGTSLSRRPLVYLELLRGARQWRTGRDGRSSCSRDPQTGRRASQLRYIYVRKRLRDSARWRPLRPGNTGRVSRLIAEAQRRDGHRVNAVYPALSPEGPAPHQSWAVRHQGLPQKPPIGNDGPQDPRHLLGRLKEPESAQAESTMRTALAGAPKPRWPY